MCVIFYLLENSHFRNGITSNRINGLFNGFILNNLLRQVSVFTLFDLTITAREIVANFAVFMRKHEIVTGEKLPATTTNERKVPKA